MLQKVKHQVLASDFQPNDMEEREREKKKEREREQNSKRNLYWGKT